MASTYVNNLRLNEMATGDGSGTWGTTTNTNLELIGQALGYGTRAIANASTDNITIADGASDSDRAMYLKLTGGGQACTVTLLPNTVSKVWMLENATSYTLTFTCGSGANVAILAGETKVIATDGGGSGGIVYDVLTDTNLAGTTKTAALTNAGALSNQGTVTVGVDDTGYDVKLFGATSGAYLLWDESADDLKLVGAAGLTVAGDIDIDGTANLDIVDIDGAVNMATTALVTGVLTTTATQVATGGITSGSSILSDTDSTDSLGSTGVRWLKGWFDTLTAGTLTIGSGSVTDSSGAISFGNENLTTTGIVTAAGTSVFTNLDISGDVDVDGTTNLDGVDIDGAVQIDAAFTSGVDGQGYDTKFFGDTASAYLLWDTSADDLILGGAAGLIVNGEISTTSAGTSNFRAGVNAGNSIASGGNYNVCVGDEAGTAITTGDRNVAVGYQSLDANDTGGENVSIGYGALTTSTSGNGLVAIGDQALEANSTAGSNTAVGKAALKSNTTGTNNTSVGKNSLDANTTANNNTSVGVDSLTTNQTGASCVAVGTYTLQNSTVSNNVAVGVSAGAAVSTGAQNTLIGTLCHDNLTTGEYCVALGYNNGPSAVDVDHEIVIGTSVTGAGTNTVRIGTSGGTATLGLDGSDTSWAAASDLRLKKDVADSTVGLSFLNDLRPVTFKWQHKNAVAEDLSQYDADSSAPIFGEGKAHHGFIAQEVKAVIDNHSDVLDGNNIWHEDPDGTQQLSQGNLVPMLVKAVQELSAKIAELEAQPRCKCSGE